MNERIRELIEQAHEQKPVIVLDPETCQPTHKIGNGGVPMYHSELNLEKFAELIVRECVKEIEFQYGGGSDQPMDNEWDRAIECVSSMVKYRFGVKE